MQPCHHCYLFGQRVRNLWRARESMLSEQSLHGTEYLLPNRHDASCLCRVWRSQPTLLSPSDLKRNCDLLARFHLPGRNRQPDELRGMRWKQPAVLCRERLHHRHVQVKRHLPLVPLSNEESRRVVRQREQ